METELGSKPAVDGGASAYALLADGTTIEIRAATPGDFTMVRLMHEAMSPDNAYLRFFGISKLSAEREATRVCRPPAPDRVALLAFKGRELVGVATYEIIRGADAEIAFAVSDEMHGRGVGTLLLEHLVSAACRRGVRRFVASVLSENAEMLKVLTDAGLTARRQSQHGVVDLACDLPHGDSDPHWEPYHEAIDMRERHADVASLRHVFQPGSVAVVGASRRTGTVGRAILHNIVTGGYQGKVYAVNPHAVHMEGVPCLPSVTTLPEPPDLAVIAVPPAAVPAVADECGRRGVKALVVITSGLDALQGADLLAACRRYGMRLVGPNCFGVAVPGIGLDATFAARHPVPGRVGLVMQSGGLGFALVDRLSRLGLGISSFASVGNKYDVSSNDLLTWWEQDGETELAVLYIESFGNPRKFARTARRLSARMPVLAIQAGRSAAGQQAATSHTAAAATPLVTRQALFEQAGVIATDSLGELLDAAALLASQPVPAGRNVAVISNVGGAGVLAADACTSCGLTVHKTSAETRRRLRALVPSDAAIAGPVDTGAAVPEPTFRRCLELVAADEGVDAVLVLVLSTAATGHLVTAIRAADVTKPLAAVVLDQAEGVSLLHRATDDGESETAGRPDLIPSYAYPEAAARALARAATYGAWRSRAHGHIPELGDVREDEARALVRTFLHGSPDGGWLPPERVTELLGCYGIPLASLSPVTSADDAARAAADLGGPVVLKADVPGVVHKTDVGGVQLDLRTEADVRRAYHELSGKFGPHARVLIQPMITGGTEVIVGVAQEPVFGPLVVFGLGGVATDVLADRAALLAPLSEADADELIHAVRSAPLLLGYRGAQPADLKALRETLLRVSRLADDLAEVAELDLNPVIARPDGVFAVDARIRITPAQQQDPFLRKLR
ncbi:MAG TPA: GNAT family N-acetyltransferase [Streptosporangiaceae bacterium]|nr:GNAT family N-acetyltransferase [Streptosporangiaceae bacterium]